MSKSASLGKCVSLKNDLELYTSMKLFSIYSQHFPDALYAWFTAIAVISLVFMASNQPSIYMVQGRLHHTAGISSFLTPVMEAATLRDVYHTWGLSLESDPIFQFFP